MTIDSGISESFENAALTDLNFIAFPGTYAGKAAALNIKGRIFLDFVSCGLIFFDYSLRLGHERRNMER